MVGEFLKSPWTVSLVLPLPNVPGKPLCFSGIYERKPFFPPVPEKNPLQGSITGMNMSNSHEFRIFMLKTIHGHPLRTIGRSLQSFGSWLRGKETISGYGAAEKAAAGCQVLSVLPMQTEMEQCDAFLALSHATGSSLAAGTPLS